MEGTQTDAGIGKDGGGERVRVIYANVKGTAGRTVREITQKHNSA